MNRKLLFIGLAFLSFILVGCGSSGGGGSTSPNGIYTGSITGGDELNNGDEKAVIYNNRVMIFSSVVSSAREPQQMFDAQINIAGATFTGSGELYDNVTNSQKISLSANFIGGTSATVDFTEIDPGAILDGTITLTMQSDLYNKGADLNDTAGSWRGTHGGVGNTTTLTITNTGGLSGVESGTGCSYNGSLSIIDSSINLYQAEITTDNTCGGFDSLDPTTTYNGFVWLEADNNALNIAVADGTKSRFATLTKN